METESTDSAKEQLEDFESGQEIRLTESADGILDVTPVNSFEETQWNNENEGKQPYPVSRNNLNESAFSSSSSSSQDEDDHFVPSEWDRALLRGKASTGRATSSDLFPIGQEEDPESYPKGIIPLNENTLEASEDALNIHKHESIIAPKIDHTDPPPPAAAPPTTTSSQSTMEISSGSAMKNAAATPSDTSVHHSHHHPPSYQQTPDDHLSEGVLPDVFLSMRQKIESLTLFDSDMMKLANEQADGYEDDEQQMESRESLKRSSQQSISAAVLVSLAHKRYERRRLAAMEIEKVVRSLVATGDLDRVRAILLLLSDDYVRSTSEDARKGGVVALAASAIGLKRKAAEAQECRDLILASVVHACQDHSSRVRYYATESLFNVVKVIPALAVQHFFILFEILRSLYADVDPDVRSGADLLDKKLKEIILSAMNSGTFSADQCVPVFARFVHMRSSKATKLLTLTWLQELNEKLIGSPILDFLHLFLGGIYDMVADPTVAIRQSALAFLQSVLPKLLVVNSEVIDEQRMKVDFDKILQSLVTTMEHPDPFVRKVAMYWMSRIVKAHIVPDENAAAEHPSTPTAKHPSKTDATDASISVRNSVPHVLPGILLSIGDSYLPNSGAKESFLPDQTTRALAEQTNRYLQDAVRRDGPAYIHHLDAFIVALREELDSPGGIVAKNPPAIERAPYRMDVKQDGNGIETPGWFRASSDVRDRKDEAMVMSRLCALDWVSVLYDHVVPTLLKSDYAREFVFAIIHQMVDNPPKVIVEKSLEVLARITVPVVGEDHNWQSSHSLSGLASPIWASSATGVDGNGDGDIAEFPMARMHVEYALQILPNDRRRLKSRDRQVFSALIQLLSFNEHLLMNFSSVLTFMCKLQPPEFVFVSFAVEVERFMRRKLKQTENSEGIPMNNAQLSPDLRFVSSFVQHMSHVLLNTKEAKEVRDVLKDCICSEAVTEEDRQRSRLFHILLHSFSHNVAATVSLCLWCGAYRTASKLLLDIDPLDINLVFLLEIDRVVELLERPFFRHLHVRMLEPDRDPSSEGSGTMLFSMLKSLLMILPQSTCYNILKDRLSSISRFRQSMGSVNAHPAGNESKEDDSGDLFVDRIKRVRTLHCSAAWQTIRVDSLEVSSPVMEEEKDHEEGSDRRSWLGYANKEEEMEAQRKFREAGTGRSSIEELTPGYHDLQQDEEKSTDGEPEEGLEPVAEDGGDVEEDYKEESLDDEEWRNYWAAADPT